MQTDPIFLGFDVARAEFPFASAPVTGVYALRGRRIGQPELLAALAESASAGTDSWSRSTLTVIRPH